MTAPMTTEEMLALCEWEEEAPTSAADVIDRYHNVAWRLNAMRTVRTDLAAAVRQLVKQRDEARRLGLSLLSGMESPNWHKPGDPTIERTRAALERLTRERSDLTTALATAEQTIAELRGELSVKWQCPRCSRSDLTVAGAKVHSVSCWSQTDEDVLLAELAELRLRIPSVKDEAQRKAERAVVEAAKVWRRSPHGWNSDLKRTTVSILADAIDALGESENHHE